MTETKDAEFLALIQDNAKTILRYDGQALLKACGPHPNGFIGIGHCIFCLLTSIVSYGTQPKVSFSEENWQKLLGIVLDQINRPHQTLDIKPDATFTDLNLDSLDKVEIIMAAEELWGLEISVEDQEKLIRLEDLLYFIESELGAKE